MVAAHREAQEDDEHECPTHAHDQKYPRIRRSTHSGTSACAGESKAGKWGFRSRIGVPSIASSPRTVMPSGSTETRGTTVVPMGLGRSFARCAKIPSSGMSERPRGRRTRCFAGSNEAPWRRAITTTCEKSPSPRRPGRYSGWRRMRDSTEPQSRSTGSVTGARTMPIERSRNAVPSAILGDSRLHERAERLDDLALFGETALRVLREDELPIRDDVEDAVVALDQPGLDSQLTSQRGPQTGGARKIVSARAVGDRDVHRGLLVTARRARSAARRLDWRMPQPAPARRIAPSRGP